jgi:CelD/BcsL family acetyltransferase involved in cellulose biosynthesis
MMQGSQMQSTIDVTRIDPVADPLWAHLVRRHRADLFLSPTWLRILEKTYGLEVEALVIRGDDGQAEAGLPYCVVSDMRGGRIVSLPFSDYCDPVVETAEQWNALISPLLDCHQPVFLRCLHNDIPLGDPRFDNPKRARWHGLALDADSETLLMGLENSARRAIRKAERNGLRVRRATSVDDVRAFFRLHLGIRKYKYRLIAQPEEFFVNIWERFRETDDDALMLAEIDGTTVGAVMYLAWGDTLYCKFSAWSAESLELRPTDLLIWEGIKHAKERGCRKLDFGLSDWDQDGLVRYKSKFASEERTISFLHYASDRVATAQERQVSALLPQLTDLFTGPSVPDDVTARAGELLYRFFT